MLFPAVIFIEPGKAYGVTLPDIPGCNTAGDTLEEAMENVQEAVELALEGGGERPVPSGVERWKGEKGLEGVVWEMVKVDLGFLETEETRG